MQLLDVTDGFAISTSPDGLAAYGELPPAVRLAAWVKPNGCPGSHRMLSLWEPVIVYPPAGRRSNRGGVGAVPDVWTGPAPRRGFHGAKPEGYTHWLLDCLTYDPATDYVWDPFPGSGGVTAAIESYAARAGVPISVRDSNGIVGPA